MAQDKPVVVKDKTGHVIGTRGQSVSESKSYTRDKSYAERKAEEEEEQKEKDKQRMRDRAMETSPQVKRALMSAVSGGFAGGPKS